MWWYVIALLVVSILGLLMGSRREGFQNAAVPAATATAVPAATATAEEAGDMVLAIKSAEEAAKKATEAAGYMKKVAETLKKEGEEKA